MSTMWIYLRLGQPGGDIQVTRVNDHGCYTELNETELFAFLSFFEIGSHHASLADLELTV